MDKVSIRITTQIIPLVSILLISIDGATTSKTNLYLAGLYPGGAEDSEVGREILPAVDMALRDVNNHPDILKDYILNIIWNDTQCDMAVATKQFFDLMDQNPPKLLLFGGECPHDAGLIARSTKWWKIWQVSYGDSNPILSDRDTYPNFFRTLPSDTEHNPARTKLLQHFNWTRVATIYQESLLGTSRFIYAHNKLQSLLSSQGLDYVTESFYLDPSTALLNLKEQDTRVIIVNFDEHVARKVFCTAIHFKMVGSRYVWILMGDYSTEWWTVKPSDDITCTTSQLRHNLEGYFTTDVLPLSLTDEMTLAGKSSRQYFKEYESRLNGKPGKFHGYAYDGIWATAQAINHVIHQATNHDTRNDWGIQDNAMSHKNDNSSRNGAFEFDVKMVREDYIHQALNESNFMGVTGNVQFRSGDRVGLIAMKQFVEGRMKTVGVYDAREDRLRMTEPIYWKGGKVPRDRALKERQIQTINSTIVTTMSMLASCGIVLASIFLFINIKFRNHSYVKMSSPNMNNVIIIGCIITYVEVLLLGFNGRIVGPDNYAILCVARSWFLCIGFTLSFGAIFCKTWRVHAIFTNATLARKVIPDRQLLFMVAVFLFVDIGILTSWQILHPTRRNTVLLPPVVDPSGSDVEIIPVLESCVSSYKNIWIGSIYAYKGLLLLFGCFLAWETRQVSIAALNDSKYIGMSVYNTVILCISGAAVSFLLEDQPDAAHLIISLFILFCTTITLCLVCVPKIIELKRDPKGKKRPIRAKLPTKPAVFTNDSTSPTYNQKIRQLMDDNYKYRCILDQKNREIVELEALLDENSNAMSNQVACTTDEQYSNDDDIQDTLELTENRSNEYQLRQRSNSTGCDQRVHQTGNNCDTGNTSFSDDLDHFTEQETNTSTYINNKIELVRVSDIMQSPYLKETDIISDEDCTAELDKPEENPHEPDVTTSLLS